MLLVSVMRLGLISAYAALLARAYLANENGSGRILTEAGDYIILG